MREFWCFRLFFQNIFRVFIFVLGKKFEIEFFPIQTYLMNALLKNYLKLNLKTNKENNEFKKETT